MPAGQQNITPAYPSTPVREASFASCLFSSQEKPYPMFRIQEEGCAVPTPNGSWPDQAQHKNHYLTIDLNQLYGRHRTAHTFGSERFYSPAVAIVLSPLSVTKVSVVKYCDVTNRWPFRMKLFVVLFALLAVALAAPAAQFGFGYPGLGGGLIPVAVPVPVAVAPIGVAPVAVLSPVGYVAPGYRQRPHYHRHYPEPYYGGYHGGPVGGGGFSGSQANAQSASFNIGLGGISGSFSNSNANSFGGGHGGGFGGSGAQASAQSGSFGGGLGGFGGSASSAQASANSFGGGGGGLFPFF
ncbi:AT-rich interactive domain-containing protein 1B-like isoform X2 [Anopheles funestus]|uniref:AT-rich interactive domain-containing protein 1B-like isoform X2 n=1 Tax=Anopheles funestus TaxID=62324 RepID=UPI0020C633BE|nr:AT-rich interactive domain-containing protein 1B-like isoform X2 [Anopheles funestus]